MARLRDGVTLDQVTSRISTITRRNAAQADEERERGWDAAVQPLVYAVAGTELRIAFGVFLGAVSFVLLIACINVSNLLLTQASMRRQELAVRSALGAGRPRLIGLLLGESLVLALLGGAIGVVLAYAGVTWLVTLAPAELPRLGEIRPNGTVLAFAVAASVIASVISGLLPALQASNTDVADTLKEGARPVGVTAQRTRRVMVAAELAISLVLLVGAGITIRGFQGIVNVDPGFSVENRLAFQVSLPSSRYPSDESVNRYYGDAIERLEGLPGVYSAAVTKTIPLGGGGSQLSRVFLEEGAPEPPAGPEHRATWFEMSPGYPATLGFAFTRGRNFSDSDRLGSNPVIIVNEAMAKQLTPDGDVIGRRIRSWRDENVYREVVGVVSDLAYFTLARPPRPAVFVPTAQSPRRTMGFLLRTESAPMQVLPAVRDVMAGLDPDIALARVATMDDVMADSVSPFRFVVLLLGIVGGLALSLATVGVYGLVSYSVAQRAHELGIRMALGAEPNRVRGLVLRQVAVVAGLGVGMGLLGGYVVSRVASRALGGIVSSDPLALGGTAGLLIAATLLASYVPARRATKVDPMEALRN